MWWRYAARQLRKNPGFALLSIATLAIGIGSATASFSILDPWLIRPLALKEPGRLVHLWRTGAGHPSALEAPPQTLSPQPASEDYPRGDQVQREERRGRDSRLTMPGGTAPGGTAAPPHRARPQTHGGAGGQTGGSR